MGILSLTFHHHEKYLSEQLIAHLTVTMKQGWEEWGEKEREGEGERECFYQWASPNSPFCPILVLMLLNGVKPTLPLISFRNPSHGYTKLCFIPSDFLSPTKLTVKIPLQKSQSSAQPPLPMCKNAASPAFSKGDCGCENLLSARKDYINKAQHCTN